MKDTLVKAIAHEGRIRVIACTATELVQEARDLFDLWPTSCAALGRTLIVGAMMGSMLKSDHEKLTIQIKGNGPLKNILVDAYYDGRVRGFVGDPEVQLIYNDSGKLAVGLAVGKEGFLRVIKDVNLKTDFTGTVELVSGEIGEDFAHYFAKSEQTPSAVSVGVLIHENEKVVISAGGLILQMMPDAEESDIIACEEALKDLPPISTLVGEGKNSIEIVQSLFEDVEILEERSIRYECDCSRDRMYGALAVIQTEEKKLMIEEDHGCEIICNYCNKQYQFSEEELKELL